jgi:hypothetical protein
MFHIELRQFPHNHSRFNLTEQDMCSLAELWVRGEWLVAGERKWSPQQAKLTVIEGPRIPSAHLSMGRGWRHAQRSGEDVTQSVLVAARAALASAADAAPARVGAREPAAEPAAGSEHAPRAGRADAGDLGSLLGEGSRAQALLAAWRGTAARFPDRCPSECLALAEGELESAHADPPR